MTTTNGNGRKENSIEELNRLFANRYTDEDDEYREMAGRPNSPPIVDDWNSQRNVARWQQNDNRNQRQNYPDNPRQNRNYSNDHQRYRDDPRNYRHSRGYSNDRRQHRGYSNHHSHYRSYSNNNRREQSPADRETRR